MLKCLACVEIKVSKESKAESRMKLKKEVIEIRDKAEKKGMGE